MAHQYAASAARTRHHNSRTQRGGRKTSLTSGAVGDRFSKLTAPETRARCGTSAGTALVRRSSADDAHDKTLSRRYRPRCRSSEECSEHWRYDELEPVAKAPSPKKVARPNAQDKDHGASKPTSLARYQRREQVRPAAGNRVVAPVVRHGPKRGRAHVTQALKGRKQEAQRREPTTSKAQARNRGAAEDGNRPASPAG
jgi:hypothetical protein